jgi:inner membrane protein
LFSLIDQEIGDRDPGPRGRIAASIALAGVVFMWGLRDFEHRRAVAALAARTYQEAEPLRVSAYPALADPFHWYGVVETSSFFVLAPVNSSGPEVDPGGDLSIRYKPEETPITLAAKKSYLGRVYLDWAQYPVTATETLSSRENGYIVDFQDLRFVQLPSLFGNWRGTRRALGAGVQLDKDLKVVGDVYGSGKAQKLYPEPK